MRRLIAIFVLAVALLSLAACGSKTIHCDRCGKEVDVEPGSKIEEDWTVYCKECHTALGLDDLIR